MLRTLDLFSGIGGFSLGLERTGGFRTVAFCEADPFCRRVLAKHWPKVPRYDDVRTLTAEALQADGIAVDVVCGGFPCQPFSTASRGRRVAVDLWPDMLRVIREVRPRYAVIENVEQAAIARAESDLRRLGYATHRRCISAADAGADHQRDRWWLCAYPNVQSELPRHFHAEVALLPKVCSGLWGPANYAGAIRVPDGLPGRLDRRRVEALGNAVLPQIPESLGRAILVGESTLKPVSVRVPALGDAVAGPKKITNALYLPEWTVEDVDRSNQKKYVVKASYDVPPGHCPKCGSTRKPYGHGTLVVPYVDAPVHGRKTTVDVTVQRYRCRDCRGTFMQPLPDTHPTRTMMLRCVEHIGEQSMFRTYAELSREIGLDESTVREVANEEIDRILANHRVTAPVALGIDELTINGKKRTIFTDIGERRVLDLIETMDGRDVRAWLRALPNKERIRIVTIDMWGPYETAIAEVLGSKVVVITDKWHVVSKANAILDVIRNAERRKGKTKKERKNPHRGRRLLQTSRHNLSPWRLFVLSGLLLNNPRIKAAWDCKETFYDIWGHEDRPSRQEAERRFDAWKATTPDEASEFRDIARMIDKRRETMFAYFDHPYTNAYTEAANGLIKISNRAGRGYRFKAIRARAITLPFRGRQRLAICEECLGQFLVEYFVSWLEVPKDRHMIARTPPHHGAQGIRVLDTCTRCRQFHTEQWLKGYHRSTLKTG